MYNIDPKGTVAHNGVTVPTILCHYDSYKLGLGSNHGDVYGWFKKHGKTMDDVRNDVANLMKNGSSGSDSSTDKSVIYRVRKSWIDSKSQVGAYSNLSIAKIECDTAGVGYEVYDVNGNVVYTAKVAVSQVKELKIGDTIQLTSGATYSNGKAIPSWIFKKTLYVRKINSNGTVTFSTLKIGPVTGTVKKDAIQGFRATISSVSSEYKVKIIADSLNIRSGAGVVYKIVGCITDKGIYTIIEEKDGWGLLKSKAGWISLKYTKKV
jgi:hypothetical protein